MSDSDIAGWGRMNVTEDAVHLFEKREREGKAIPLFTYGTLRVGERLHDHYSSGVVKIRKEATTKGAIYYPGHRYYPEAQFTHEGTIVGDILWHPLDSRELAEVIEMELRSGYELVVVEATYERRTARPKRKKIKVLAFQAWSFDPEYKQVPGNDWCGVHSRQLQGQRGF